MMVLKRIMAVLIVCRQIRGSGDQRATPPERVTWRP